jgi:hypothetical protein
VPLACPFTAPACSNCLLDYTVGCWFVQSTIVTHNHFDAAHVICHSRLTRSVLCLFVSRVAGLARVVAITVSNSRAKYRHLHHVAIIGGGPSGFYTAHQLLKVRSTLRLSLDFRVAACIRNPFLPQLTSEFGNCSQMLTFKSIYLRDYPCHMD